MIKNNEVWKDIEGYEGLYQISNFGRVKSFNYLGHGKIQILKPRIVGRGYHSVQLCVNYKSKYKYIHRLVAKHFIPNASNHKYVNHKDEYKTNNHVNNLEWCTMLYNNLYNGRQEIINQKNSKPIIQYTIDGKLVKYYNKQIDVEEDGFTQQSVSKCCNNKQKTHKGYVWKFAINVDDGFNKEMMRFD